MGRSTAAPHPVSFALVAYEAGPGGALEAATLDSGLTPQDCAFAIGAAARLETPALLISCTPETGR